MITISHFADIDDINNIPVKIYTDGCSKGNPGHSGAGIVIKNNAERNPFNHKNITLGSSANLRSTKLAII